MSRLHMGIDVGSTTVKVVVLDENNNTLFAEYRRHFSDIKSTVKGLGRPGPPQPLGGDGQAV